MVTIRRQNIEIGTFKSFPIVEDWQDWEVSFSHAEDGSIVLVAGWDCEIWLHPDGTYYCSINPKLYSKQRRQREQDKVQVLKVAPPHFKLPWEE